MLTNEQKQYDPAVINLNCYNCGTVLVSDHETVRDRFVVDGRHVCKECVKISYGSQPVIMDRDIAVLIVKTLHPKKSVNCAVKMTRVDGGYVVRTLLDNTIFHTDVYASAKSLV
jgi:hypothetical protein